MVVTVRRQDLTLAICCDAIRFKRFFIDPWKMTSVFPSKFPVLTNHYYCASPMVSHTDIIISVFSDLRIPWIERFTSIIKLNRFSKLTEYLTTLDWVMPSLYIVARKSPMEVTHRLLGVHPLNLMISSIFLSFYL